MPTQVVVIGAGLQADDLDTVAIHTGELDRYLAANMTIIVWKQRAEAATLLERPVSLLVRYRRSTSVSVRVYLTPTHLSREGHIRGSALP